ncbi:hypothetical protein ACN9MU_05810 [Pseudoduganella sp. R-32]|jgi:hypothetical protein|uniref:hypothetical protein n=1 Tax=unclassified Pseudoduganella TaxID=2637179 RepID=UPI003CEFC07F
MENLVEIHKDVILNSLVNLNWIDVNLFRLGTSMGEKNLTKQEISELLFDFFVKNDVGNKLASIKHLLRSEVEQYLIYDDSGISDLDRMYEKNLIEFPPMME